MKINKFKFPSIFRYYVVPERLNIINNNIIDSTCEIDDGSIYITVESSINKDIMEVFNYYKENYNISVRDHHYHYDHEIDISRISSDKLFEIETEDNKQYKCNLDNHYMDKNCIVIELEIVN